MKIIRHDSESTQIMFEGRAYTTETNFLTEDAGTGDATVPVILDRICAVLLAVIIALGVIVIGHAALSACVGEWL